MVWIFSEGCVCPLYTSILALNGSVGVNAGDNIIIGKCKSYVFACVNRWLDIVKEHVQLFDKMFSIYLALFMTTWQAGACAHAHLPAAGPDRHRNMQCVLGKCNHIRCYLSTTHQHYLVQRRGKIPCVKQVRAETRFHVWVQLASSLQGTAHRIKFCDVVKPLKKTCYNKEIYQDSYSAGVYY